MCFLASPFQSYYPASVMNNFLLSVFCSRLPSALTRPLCPAAMVHPARQRAARQVWDFLPGEPGPLQRVQVQRGVLGLALPVPARRLQLDHPFPASHLEAGDWWLQSAALSRPDPPA